MSRHARQSGGVDRLPITLVVARAQNGVIGRDGKLPWPLPADLKRFKALTMNSAMVMGRRTFESLPGLLPGRRHIVLTRDRDWSAGGAEVAHGIEQALAFAAGQSISVIGGGAVFLIFLPPGGPVGFKGGFGGVAGGTMIDGSPGGGG